MIDSPLDDPSIFKDRDPGGMLALVENFPGQFKTRPEEETRDIEAFARCRRLWISAMGGSAFAGEMVAAGLEEAGLSATILRGYTLPAAAGAEDWLLALSYSGNTEEVLSVFAEAARRGLKRVAISSGGRLAEAAQAARVPWLSLEPGYPPRAAAGFAYAAAWQVARIGCRSVTRDFLMPANPGVVGRHLSPCFSLWGRSVPAAKNPAKSIALALHGRLPVVYSGVGPPEAALLRWRTQINENAKALCHTAVVPELDHNEVVGWSGPDLWNRQASVVFLREGREDKETTRRLNATREWMDRRGVVTTEVLGQGESVAERLWWLCHLGDYVSVYLAALRGVDPTPVNPIDELKRRLAEDHS